VEKSKFIGLKVTEEQYDKYHGWPGSNEEHADYLRQCIESRFAGDVEELRRRRDLLRSKAAEFNTEAAELDQMIVAEEEREDSISFSNAREQYLLLKIFEREHEHQINWLVSAYRWSRVRCNEFLAWVNADRTGEVND